MTYPGGKNGAGVYQTIINLMPPHEVYIEPFLGGAAIMRLKRPARLNIGVDLDPIALELARAAASQLEPPKLAMPPGRGKVASIAGNVERRHGIAGNTERRRRGSSDPASSAEISGNGDKRSRIADSDDPGPRLLNGDGIGFLEAYTFTGHELVYCDPPYLLSTRASGPRYRFEMTLLEHRHLLRVLQDLPCMVMISGYSSALYARELKGWNATAFQATTRGAPAAEWVWYNFERPVALHDYRYLGRDFRERERIRRKIRRWSTRLQKMPALERQAMLAAIATIA